MFQHREESNVRTAAMELGSNIDYMLNLLMIKHIKDEKKQIECLERIDGQKIGLDIVKNGDLCSMFDVPEMVKQWYIDFLQSGYEVLDVQPHFVIEELDYHGFADALFSLDGQRIVIENKTTSKYYDKFFSSKKHSMQAVGYAIGLNTDAVRYQFFNTRNMTDYCSASLFVRDEDKANFKEWVQFVRDNEHSMVRNTEWCSYNDCPLRDYCMDYNDEQYEL